MKKILIGGGTGLVGSNLKRQLEEKGHEVFILSRSNKNNDPHIITWNLSAQEMDLGGLQPDIVINLTGAGIADKPWTKQRKKILIDSRVDSTAVFQKYIENSLIKPEVYLSASAVGIYGDRGDEELDENAAEGNADSFLVHCCQLWEEAVNKLTGIVDRVLILRIGLVLSNQGGALEKMVLPVKMGGAAYFGNGNQYYPWIHIDDLSRSIIHLIEDERSSGIYNGVGPKPQSMKTFMKVLKKHFRSWALSMPVPSFFLKVAMGEMSKILLNSNRVIPKRLIESGFSFKFNTLDEAINNLKSNPTK